MQAKRTESLSHCAMGATVRGIRYPVCHTATFMAHEALAACPGPPAVRQRVGITNVCWMCLSAERRDALIKRQQEIARLRDALTPA
jgi:hypothetical protein